MEEMYERRLTGTTWIICLVMTAVGLVVWAGGCLICLNQDVMGFLALSAVAFVLMLTGVEGLIGQWSENYIETLSKEGIRRGFGMLLIGGIIAVITSVTGIILQRFEDTPLWMLLGAVIVTVCTGICISSFRKTGN